MDLRILFLGVIIPGSGVSMRAVQTAADKEPVIIGKPSKAMFEYIKDRYIFTDLVILTEISCKSIYRVMVFFIFVCSSMLFVPHSIFNCT